MNPNKIDLLLKYILAVAGQEDFGNREVGPIHLIKYLYLADLAYAEKHDGQTFSGVPWQFYHFGPWAIEVFNRIEPVIAEVGATERRFSHPKYEDDIIRWTLIDDYLYEELDRQLPLEICLAVKRAVHKFGADTTSLLHYVYTTLPMLQAAPGEYLDFSSLESPYEQIDDVDVSDQETEPLSAKAKKRRKEVLKDLQERIRSKLAKKKRLQKLVIPDPPPRYDDVFFEGLNYLDELAGPSIESEEGEIIFSADWWKSPGRSDPDVS